ATSRGRTCKILLGGLRYLGCTQSRRLAVVKALQSPSNLCRYPCRVFGLRLPFVLAVELGEAQLEELGVIERRVLELEALEDALDIFVEADSNCCHMCLLLSRSGRASTDNLVCEAR